MDFSIDPGRQQNIQVRTTANDVYSASRNKFSIWLKTIRPNHTSFAGALGDDDVKLFKFHAGKEGFPVEKIIELPAATDISFEWTHSNLERGRNDGIKAAEAVLRHYKLK